MQKSLIPSTLIWLLFILLPVARAADPGTPPSSSALLSGQKPGSVLIYNLYTSNIGAPPFEEAEINLVNSAATTVTVRLFFVNGQTGAVKSEYFCLGPNQMVSYLASQIDPGGSGYVVAVAVDGATGCPISHNFLIGDAYLKLSDGPRGGVRLNAVAIAANFSGASASCRMGDQSAMLEFNGGAAGYNQLPRVLAVDNIPARADGNSTLLVVNRIGGNLATGVNALGSLSGFVFDDDANLATFATQVASSQLREPLSNKFPLLDIPLELLITAGRSGWLKLWAESNSGLLGAAINFNPNVGASAAAFNWGQNLRQLTLAPHGSYLIPAGPLNCTNRPALASLSPDTAAAGSGALTLTIRGARFVNGAAVRWNGVTRPTTFISATQLTAAINAADLTGGGAANVTVVNLATGPPSNALSFAISQPCSYSLPAGSQAFVAGGGAGNFRINAGLGCQWEAASNADWVMIAPGARGRGDGTIGYVVAANPGSTARNGTITIGGRSFTVTQAGFSQPLTELSVDDGTMERNIGLTNGGTAYFVNRLTPNSYPATLSAVTIFFHGNIPANAPFILLAGSNVSGGANINGVALRQIPMRVKSLGQFSTYEIPSLTITSGDFVVGFQFTEFANLYPVAQDSSTSRTRSYLSLDGVNFNLIEDDNAALAGNFGIRAQLMATPASCPLPSSLLSSVGAPDTNVAINGTDFNGLTAVKFAHGLPAPFVVNSNTRVTAAIPPGALTGGITLGKNGCPDVRTGFFNVNLSSATELLVDDGTHDFSVGLTNGGTSYYVNRLTPITYPATLSSVAIYFANDSRLQTGTPFTLMIGANPSGGTNINGISFQQINAQVQSLGQFNVFTTPSIILNSGDFVIGVRFTYSAGVFPMAEDATPPSQRRSYSSGDGASFKLIEEDNARLAGNFLIRARLARICNYALAPMSQTFTADGGNGSVNMTTVAECDWAAQSSDPWLSITSGATGNGNGTVRYTVAANTSVNPRSASITAGGQTLTVIQTGANPVPVLAGVNPLTVTAGGPGFTLTVNGTDFVNGAGVRWNGASRATNFVSSSQLTAQILAADIAGSSLAKVTVVNPAPGGGTSNELVVPINGRITSVSAASFTGAEIAIDSIVTAFGTGLATGTGIAGTLPLPTSLLGTTIRVRDSGGSERLAPLFFVAPQQINFLAPPQMSPGVATITVMAGNGAISTGQVQVAAVAPGLFTANADGRGVAAAVILRVKVDGTQSYESVSRFDSSLQRFVPIPLDLGPETDQLFLILSGTGFRGRSQLSAITAQVGGVNVPTLFAGAQGVFVGLDQVNLGPLPRSLSGRGVLDIVITVDGKIANTAQIAIQ